MSESVPTHRPMDESKCSVVVAVPIVAVKLCNGSTFHTATESGTLEPICAPTTGVSTRSAIAGWSVADNAAHVASANSAVLALATYSGLRTRCTGALGAHIRQPPVLVFDLTAARLQIRALNLHRDGSRLAVRDVDFVHAAYRRHFRCCAAEAEFVGRVD